MGMREEFTDKCKAPSAGLDAETIKQREQELAASLTAESTDLLPYLPYLLQDIYELGSSPADIEVLLRENTDFGPWFRVLDLACGKGAVSIHLAAKFGCSVKGVDFMQTFVNDAIVSNGRMPIFLSSVSAAMISLYWAQPVMSWAISTKHYISCVRRSGVVVI